MLWKLTDDAADPRFFRVALQLSLIWTFSYCVSQRAGVPCCVAYGFGMSSGMNDGSL